VDTFKDFYNRERQRFLAYLIRRGGDYHLACDILQESFARLYEKYAERFSPQLLYTIGRNLLLDELRRRKHPPVDQECTDLRFDSQEHEMLVHESYGQVLAAMRQLTDDERDLLALVVSRELPYREIAEITGISVVNVKVKIHRARQKLRKILGADNHERTLHQRLHRQ
jgi:RNA polymerase sigma-70 factor, ECF subfamily